MNPDVKKKWVEALRSGEYDQTTGWLTNEYGTKFCCLGVLCDLYARETKGKAGFVEKGPGLQFESENGSSNAELTDDVQLWAGLESSSPEVYDTALMDLNDIEGFSFNEIADLIEEDL